MNYKKALIILSIIPLASCSHLPEASKNVFCFDTMNRISIYNAPQEEADELAKILELYDKLSDNYRGRDILNVCSINSTNEDVAISKELYDLLKVSYEFSKNGNSYFDIMSGKLSKLWKEDLKNKVIPTQQEIDEQLEIIKNSSLEFKDNNIVKRNGDAEIDLGGIVKGYVLDLCKNYLKSKEVPDYLISLGDSSILLGDKNSYGADKFKCGIKGVNEYFYASNICISTSGVSEQGVTIDNVTYSHIVNPLSGSAINNYDEVLVLGDSGYLGDALSTAFMMETLDEIKADENKYNVKAIVIKDNKIIYSNPSIEIFK